jgi:hypothetical protein
VREKNADSSWQRYRRPGGVSPPLSFEFRPPRAKSQPLDESRDGLLLPNGNMKPVRKVISRSPRRGEDALRQLTQHGSSLEKQCIETLLFTLPVTNIKLQPSTVEIQAGGRAGLQRSQGKQRSLQSRFSEPAIGATKSLKVCEPGFVHIDVWCLSEAPDESQRRYLYLAIDSATQWVFLHVHADQTEGRCVDFLNRLREAAPMKITAVLTRSSLQFTDRFKSKTRDPSNKHSFEVRCGALGIEHLLVTPFDGQITRVAGRVCRRVSEVLRQAGPPSGGKLKAALAMYCKCHNQLTPLPALKNLTPNQVLKNWASERPDLFVKRVKKLHGLDS